MDGIEFNRQMVFLEGDYIVLDTGVAYCQYDFHKDLCNDKEKLISWIDHLCEKMWVTPQHISQLIAISEKISHSA